MEASRAVATRGDVGTIEAPASEMVGANEASGLVRLAIEQKVPVEVLERLVALQERVTARDAEMAMAQALARFQEACPPVPRIKTAEVKKEGRKQYEYKFAPLDEVVRVIRPHLAAHGLSFTHDGTVTPQGVEIVCTLQHVAGATRTATFRGPIDASGGKNPIQQVASARSYGRRYTLMDVLGITTQDDDDGHGGGEDIEIINESQAADLRSLMKDVGANEQKYLEYLQVESVDVLPADRYREAVQALEDKRRKVAR